MISGHLFDWDALIPRSCHGVTAGNGGLSVALAGLFYKQGPSYPRSEFVTEHHNVLSLTARSLVKEYMVAPRVPKASYSIVFTLFGGLAVWFIWACLGWSLSTGFLGLGLVLDILGAFVLAIPDLPSVHSYFFSGKLKTALNQLQFKAEGSMANQLAAPDIDERLLDALLIVEDAKHTTVHELLQNPRHKVIRESDPPSEGFYELREAFKETESNREAAESWDGVYGFKVFEGTRGIKSITMRVEDGEPRKHKEGPFYFMYTPVEEYLDDLVARFRRLGFILLMIGFVFQGLSIAFP